MHSFSKQLWELTDWRQDLLDRLEVIEKIVDGTWISACAHTTDGPAGGGRPRSGGPPT